MSFSACAISGWCLCRELQLYLVAFLCFRIFMLAFSCYLHVDYMSAWTKLEHCSNLTDNNPNSTAAEEIFHGCS